MEKYNCIIIEDEPLALERTKDFVNKIPFLNLSASFDNALTGLAYLNSNEVDLLFLDINMDELSGIELLENSKINCQVIITTAYQQYALKGYELRVTDYLLKPFSLARFTKACNKALEIKQLKQEEKVPDFIFLKTGYEEEKVLLADILYVEAEGNYMAYILKKKKLLCRQSISDALTTLPESQFVRIHRSFIVALGSIQKITRQSVWIQGVEVPVGASYEEKLGEVRERLKVG